jgi:hypothetical protein
MKLGIVAFTFVLSACAIDPNWRNDPEGQRAIYEATQRQNQQQHELQTACISAGGSWSGFSCQHRPSTVTCQRYGQSVSCTGR